MNGVIFIIGSEYKMSNIKIEASQVSKAAKKAIADILERRELKRIKGNKNWWNRLFYSEDMNIEGWKTLLEAESLLQMAELSKDGMICLDVEDLYTIKDFIK